MTTLENSYCVPRTVEECKALDIKPLYMGVPICKSWRSDGLASYMDTHCTEIPVSRFLDLLNDRCKTWRFEECWNGYSVGDNKTMYYKDTMVGRLIWNGERIYIDSLPLSQSITFSEVMTLHKLLTRA